MFNWVNEDTIDFMSKGYLQSGQTVEERVRQIAHKVGKYYGGREVEDKIYDYMGKGYYSLSSPIWSNYAADRGLPISCNNVYVGDTLKSILSKQAEVGMQTKMGAGTSGYFGDIRPRGSIISEGGKADGPVHFMSLFENVTDIISQGSVRRGNFAAYLDITHPDIMEFLEAREGEHYLQKISMGVCISDEFMQSIIDGHKENRQVWGRLLKKRNETGYPYIFWTDTVNNNKPDHYKNHKIYGSNLCSEIAQPSNEEESFVCDLMSMNIATFDEWSKTDAVEVAIIILDAVMEEYLYKVADNPLMSTSYNSAKRWRALGLGTLGYHSALQSKMIPFESLKAKIFNIKVHKLISERAERMTHILARELGEPQALRGTGRRNATLMAIAPTTSSSFILGQISPSIEPLAGNIMTKDLAKGKYIWKNPYLANLLQSKGKDTDTVWDEINWNYGSIQSLDVLNEDEKAVFKTFSEVDQLEVISQAAQRQKFIDQSQSINLTYPEDVPLSKINNDLINAWRLGVKTLYYQRPFFNKSQKLSKTLLSDNCVACEA